MSPLDMAFFTAVILAVIKIVQFWIWWEFGRE